jgi:hypothetical protein
MLFILPDMSYTFWVQSNGQYDHAVSHGLDIVSEWRDPRQWEVYIVEYENGIVRAALHVRESHRHLIRACATVTEGEGLDK